MNVPLSLGAQARRKINTSVDSFIDLFSLPLPTCLTIDLATHRQQDRRYIGGKPSFRESVQDDLRASIKRRATSRNWDWDVYSTTIEFFVEGVYGKSLYNYWERVRWGGARWKSFDEPDVHNLEAIGIPLFTRVAEETLMHEWFGIKVCGINVKLCFYCAKELCKLADSHELKFFGLKEVHDNALTLMRAICSRENWCWKCNQRTLFWMDTVRHNDCVGRIVAFDPVFRYPSFEDRVGRIVTLGPVFRYPSFEEYASESDTYNCWCDDVPEGESYSPLDRSLLFDRCLLNTDKQGMISVTA